MRTLSCAPMLAIILVTACAQDNQEPVVINGTGQMAGERVPSEGNSDASTHSIAVAPPTDAWIGRWLGPEGLFLDIQPSKESGAGHYTIVNKDTLDRQGDYGGIAEGMTIRFVRDGKDMTIQSGTGVDTGFRYLAEKKNCLIVIQGKEGYCR